MEALGGGAVYYERGTSVRLAFCAGNARRPHPEPSSAAALCRQEEARSPIYSANCIAPLNKRETWGPSERIGREGEREREGRECVSKRGREGREGRRPGPQANAIVSGSRTHRL